MVRAECCAVAEQRAHLNDFSFGALRLLKSSITTAASSTTATTTAEVISIDG
jgi:hypothetical protein